VRWRADDELPVLRIGERPPPLAGPVVHRRGGEDGAVSEDVHPGVLIGSPGALRDVAVVGRPDDRPAVCGAIEELERAVVVPAVLDFGMSSDGEDPAIGQRHQRRVPAPTGALDVDALGDFLGPLRDELGRGRRPRVARRVEDP
jgi:hypothetical protein